LGTLPEPDPGGLVARPSPMGPGWAQPEETWSSHPVDKHRGRVLCRPGGGPGRGPGRVDRSIDVERARADAGGGAVPATYSWAHLQLSSWSQDCPVSPVLFVIFMDRISRPSLGLEQVSFGGLGIASLLFADDVVLLAFSDRALRHSLGRFAAECEAAGMRVSTSKSSW